MRKARIARLSAVAAIVLSSSVLVAGCGSSGASTTATSGCTLSSGEIVLGPNSGARNLGPGNYEVKLTVGKLLRCLILFVPPNPAVKNRPLVLVYHGATDTAASTEQGTDFESNAKKTGEVIAFMQGYSNSWNDAEGSTPASRAHVNDIGFTTAAISKIERFVTFDHKKVVAAGFSNGALMVQLLGCRIASKLRLIVPVEGEMPVNVSKTCKPANPISVYEVHGTADTAIPYGGGTFVGYGGGTITVLSAPNTVALWARLDSCSSTPDNAYPSQDIKVTTYASCKDSALSQLRTIYGGVHQWGDNIGQLVAAAIPSK